MYNAFTTHAKQHIYEYNPYTIHFGSSSQQHTYKHNNTHTLHSTLHSSAG